jgi:hypothetical protein
LPQPPEATSSTPPGKEQYVNWRPLPPKIATRSLARDKRCEYPTWDDQRDIGGVSPRCAREFCRFGVSGPREAFVNGTLRRLRSRWRSTEGGRCGQVGLSGNHSPSSAPMGCQLFL